MDRMSEHSNKDFLTGMSDEKEVFEESIKIRRWKGFASEDPVSGFVGTPQYDEFYTTAVIDDIGIDKVKSADGIYAAGDLVFQITIRLQEPIANTHEGDRIVYDGIEYFLVGKPMITYFAGVVYYETIGRRTTN